MSKKLFVGVDDEWWLCRAVAVASALAHGSGLHSLAYSKSGYICSRLGPSGPPLTQYLLLQYFATAELLAGRSTTSVALLSRDKFKKQIL